MNFLDQEFVICHNGFMGYQFSFINSDFVRHMCSGIDINSHQKILLPIFWVCFIRKHTQSCKLQGKFNIKCISIYI